MNPTVALAATVRTPGGVWRHVEDLAIGLRDRGWEVELGLPADAAELRARAAGLHLAVKPPDETVRAGIDLWHLHLHDTYEPGALALLARRRRYGAALITEHLPRTNVSDPKLLAEHPRTRGAARARWLFKRAEFALATRVVAVSAGSASFLRERYGLAESKLKVVRNGIAPGAPADPPGGSAPGLRLVSVGSLIVQKGYDLLLAAARTASAPWTVEIAGEGPHRARWEMLAAATGNRVRFLGRRDDIDALMHAADAVCMPSRWESFPYVALEAMHAARPLIGSRVDGLEEIVVDGVTGVLVAPGDAAALARSLDGFARTHPSQRARMGAAALERVNTLYPLEVMLSAIEDVYGEVLGR